jgi:hypothetical protein
MGIEATLFGQLYKKAKNSSNEKLKKAFMTVLGVDLEKYSLFEYVKKVVNSNNMIEKKLLEILNKFTLKKIYDQQRIMMQDNGYEDLVFLTQE